MGKPLRLLIAEDSSDDAELLLVYLRRAGFEPLHERVYTAEAMEAALNGQAWDILISDNSMPCFSAAMALEMVKKKGSLR